MRILEIYIYGYGKIENLVIKDITNLQVFYGANEAGKSTVMSFIHSILFGFPTKQQSELRYEPKSHTKYGGKLVISHPFAGQVTIERVKGKATGDVLVKTENGTSGGEELLSKLLKRIDKAMFQSIFSFNLNGLQNIHQVKSEDLGKFLFSTGAVGTDKLLKVENELKKELDNRFKPGGKKPFLNEQLKELHELHLKLKEAQQKNEAYSINIQKGLSLEVSIEKLQIELKNLQYKTNRLHEWKNHFPYVQELKLINQELDSSKSFSFPLDGIKRFEAMEQILKPIEAQLAGIVDKQMRLKEELSQIEVNYPLLKEQEKLESALANISLFDQLTYELTDIKHQLETNEDKIVALKEKLSYSIDEEQLSTIETSIFMKEKIGQAQSKLFRLNDQKQMLDQRFHDEKMSLEQLEKEMSFLEERLLPNEQRMSLTKKVKQAVVQEQVKKELNDTQEKIKIHKETRKIKNSEIINSKRQTSFLLLFFVFLSIWSGFNKEWGLLAITGACFLLLTLLYLKKRSSSPQNEEIVMELLQKEKQLLAKLESSKELATEQIQSQLQTDDRLLEQIQIIKLRGSQQQLRYEQVIEAYESWESESKLHKDTMKNLYAVLYLPNHIPFESLNDAFEIIVNLKNLTGEKGKLQERQYQINEKQHSIYTKFNELAEQFLSEKKESMVEIGMALKEAFKIAQQNSLQSESTIQKIAEIETDYTTVQMEKQYLVRELQELFGEAFAKSEDEFRSKAIEAKRMEVQFERKTAIERQIQMAGFSTTDLQEFENISQLNDQIGKWNDQFQQLEETLAQQQNDYAAMNYQINLLSEGGTYTELLQRYKQLKYELDEQARIWGKYAVAKHLLTKTIERYKNEKLPLLLNKAEEYFSYLTMGSYIRIHARDEGSGFQIERNDHTFFEANELSQATMEQVYVSIRLALATTLFEQTLLPIVIDDSFVNFDQKRTERMLKLLNRINDHQILFFTCHTHLLSQFEERQILDMGKMEEVIRQ